MKFVMSSILFSGLVILGGNVHAQVSKKAAPDDGGIAGGAANCFVSNCPADTNGSASVNVDDLLAIINAWGDCPRPCSPATCPSDVAPEGGDCAVNVDDLLGIINGWGACPPPPNDDCSGAEHFQGGGSTGGFATKAFCTASATTDGPATPTCNFCCGDPTIHNDVWYYFNTSEFGPNYWIELNTCGTPFDTKIAVYRASGIGGCSCPAGNMTLVACNDDIGDGSACNLNSRVRFQASALSCYRVRVGGFNGQSGPGVLNGRSFRMGDECFAAIDLGTVTANTNLTASAYTGSEEVTAGTVVTQAPCTPFPDGRDYWYKFQIGCGGNVIGSVNTCDFFTDFDTILTLYRGTCEGLVLVGCNDDSTLAPCQLNGQPRKSLVDLPNAAQAGYYYVRISGYQGAVGVFKVNIGLSCLN